MFGGAVRPPLDPAEAVHRLARPRCLRHHLPRQRRLRLRRRRRPRRRPHLAPFRDGAGGDRPRRADGDDEPVLAPGVPRRRLHQQRPRRTPLRDPQGRRPDRPRAPSSAPRSFVAWGGREGAESGAAKDVRAALDRYKEAFDMLGAVRPRAGLRHPVRDRAQAQRAARRHPAADDRPRAGVHQRARAPRDGRPQPGGRARGDGRRSTTRTASPRRCGTASSSTSTSTARPARASTRTCASAPATRAARSGPSTSSRTVATTGRGTSTSSRRAPRTWTACGPRPRAACATT